AAFGETVESLLRGLVELGPRQLAVAVEIVGKTHARSSARTGTPAAGTATSSGAPTGSARPAAADAAGSAAGNHTRSVAVHLLEAVALARQVFVLAQL